jgi:lipid II:glycine glycyltransferase (peptidoglycan interpeptide bridge formation enzyme)
LQLTALETFDARAGMFRHLISVSVGTVSVILALVLPIERIPLSGLFYFIQGPLHFWFGYRNGNARARLVEESGGGSG